MKSRPINYVVAACLFSIVSPFWGGSLAYANIKDAMANGGAGGNAVGSLGPTFYAFNNAQGTMLHAPVPSPEGKRVKITNLTGKVIGSYNPAVITTASGRATLRSIVNIDGLNRLHRLRAYDAP